MLIIDEVIPHPDIVSVVPIMEERKPMKAVVLLSGGMDSATAMAQAQADGAEELIGVSVRYGSKHQNAEMNAAVKVAAFYQAQHLVVSLPGIFESAGSALMGDAPMPHQTYEQIHEMQGPSPTVVPFRNANLLSIATTMAIKYGAQYVYMGAHGEDAHNFAYPDCTPEFLGAMANAIYVGSYHEVRLQFPLIWMSKADVCALALKLRAPLHLTWSCYDPVHPHPAEASMRGSEWLQCGECPTCVERIAAFVKNRVIDPIPYAQKVNWMGCIPYHIVVTERMR